MNMRSTAVRLSASTFEIVWHRMGFDDLPTPLFVPPAGATGPARRAAEQAAVDELRGLGLIDGRDELDDEVTEAFQVLCRPADEFYGWFVRSDNTVFSAVAAVCEQRAVLAVLEESAVWLSGISPDTPAQAVVGVAPRLAPVRANSVSAPADDFYLPSLGAVGRADSKAASADGNANDGVVRGRVTPKGHEAAGARLRALVAQPSIGRGQLFVATRDQLGRRRKSARPIYYLDTDGGRWMFHFSAPRGGQPWLTAAPGAPEVLARAMYDTHRELLTRSG